MKVIIIGGGVAGLTMALACQHAGFTVKIYEKSRTLRNIGGGILVWPHGIRYLNWLGLSHCLEPYWVSLKRCNIVDYQGATIFNEDFSNFTELVSGEALPIERHLFQHTLLKALPENCLSLGKECISVVDGAESARVVFADGSEEEADLVVGADGIHSSVRKTILTDVAPVYTGLCWWGGVVDGAVIPHFPRDESYVGVGRGKAFFAWPSHGDKFIWYLPVRMHADALTIDANGLLQLQAICADWNADIQKIISASIDDNRFHLAINTLPALTAWSGKRVTLIGDAAHATGPILAQGTSLAIEDAFALTTCLQKNTGDMAGILKHYESLRYDKYARVLELENQSAQMLVSDELETLAELQQHMKYLDLATMYKELIPLVDEAACIRLAESCYRESEISVPALF
jgi:2-polyprenyl-6-methoxyphenol hydroxylase-like FAD-dependent oxidoreductase